MRNSKTHKKKKLPFPGPQQCHPKVKDSKNGCIPNDILVEVANNLQVKATRGAIEKYLNIKPHNEYSFVKALPFDDLKKNQIIKEYLRPKKKSIRRSIS